MTQEQRIHYGMKINITLLNKLFLDQMLNVIGVSFQRKSSLLFTHEQCKTLLENYSIKTYIRIMNSISFIILEGCNIVKYKKNYSSKQLKRILNRYACLKVLRLSQIYVLKQDWYFGQVNL